ncbi:MAG: pentapeptide repeat-containing protein [Coleofasciculus sp. D1-CHI-01]|uniref:pentapeptide repeat-containing protein n=1 Tax=Coleofasciculus sp. D1-CHI-01 TaxID=3068482 RepID=UPI0032F83A0B
MSKPKPSTIHDNIKLNGATLQDAQLCGADLTEAKLCGAQLSDAKLTGADLTGADLTGADLRKANLRNANLSGINLSGANVQGAQCKGNTGLTEDAIRNLKKRGAREVLPIASYLFLVISLLHIAQTDEFFKL